MKSELKSKNLDVLKRQAAIAELYRRGELHWKLHKGQTKMYEAFNSSPNKIYVINSSRRLGKCLAEGTEVMTPTGPVAIENLKAGDTVYGYNQDGSVSQTQVVAVEYQGEKEVISMTAMGKEIVAATPEHRWVTVGTFNAKEKLKNTEQLRAKGVYIRREFVQIPCGTVHEPHAYAIGALLGNGCAKQGGNRLYISSEDDIVPKKVQSILGAQYLYSGHESNYTWVLSTEPPGVGKGSSKHSDTIHCNYYNEWIKDRYAHEKTLDWSVIDTWDRDSCLNLLAGLLDTDGSIAVLDNRLKMQFSLMSKAAVEVYIKLVWKLFQFKIVMGTENRDTYKNGPMYLAHLCNTEVNRRILKEVGDRLVTPRKRYNPEWEKLATTNYTTHKQGVKLGDKRIARCWDIQVGNKTNLYLLANGLVTHNSYLLSLVALEHALKHDGIQIKYAAPNQKMARKIIFPLIQQILEGCPVEIKPKFHRHDGEFIFKNGSVITVCGTEMGQVDGLRGTACDLALIDECGFMDNLTYVIDDVLMPQMLDRPNSRMILASTPPVSPDHPYVTKYIKNAMENGAYAKFTIYDNPRLHPDQIEEFKKEAGGETSTTWRREYMAEIVTDTDNAIFPEATADSFMEQIVFEIPKPTFFIPITAIDLGYIDYTGVLFGYYHFLLNKIVIEDELLINRTNSALLIDMIKTKEVALWGKTPVKNRVVDGPALVIADLNEQHRFGCRTPDKGDFVARVNRARVDLAAEKVILHPRCEKTRTQIQHAVWDSSRKSFARNSSGGHFDLAAAFIYLIAHINRTQNPYPADFGYNQYTDFGFPRQHKNTAKEAFKKMFKFLPERRK